MIYELAGIVGVDPSPFTLRELAWMAEGRQRESWNHTSQVLAMLFNAHRDRQKTQAAVPADFHPLSKKKRASDEPLPADISVLKTFVR
ncbi:MAG: hypothetical protein AB7O62_05500 [Pirellulales bacterium]